MNTLVTITPKFQVYLPTKIRQVAGIDKHGRAKMMAKKGRIIIEPVIDEIMDLGGKYKSKKKVDVEKIRDYIDYSRI